METIAADFLKRGDAVSALPILGTLALGASGTTIQRLRRLQHARLYREVTAVLACLGDVEGLNALGESAREISDADRESVCDALLDDALPSQVFFGCVQGTNATKRLHKLRLAVHPDKCKATNAAKAVSRLHDRKAEFDESTSDEAPPTAEKSGTFSSPNTFASPTASPVSESKSRLASTFPSASNFPASPKNNQPFSRTVASPTHRADRAPRCRKSPVSVPEEAKLQNLMDSCRNANSFVRLQSDLSFEACAPESPKNRPSSGKHFITVHCDDGKPVMAVRTNVEVEFTKVREAFLAQLHTSAVTSSAPARVRGCENAVEEALKASYFQQPGRQTVVVQGGAFPALPTKHVAGRRS